jgi:hypothetical protein
MPVTALPLLSVTTTSITTFRAVTWKVAAELSESGVEAV